MKVTKIPGLGRFGIFIDDVDLNHISDEEWFEIGKLHLENFVTIIRNTNLDTFKYQELIFKLGTPRINHVHWIQKKYGMPMNKIVEAAISDSLLIDDKDKKFLKIISKLVLFENNQLTSILKVTGVKDEHGDPLGMFAEGELLWHSDESGDLCFTHGTALLGKSGVIGSATGFVTTVDYYESLTESFRSELDEMVLLHRFIPGKINPGLREDQDLIMNNMCPENDTEIPLVIKGPGGHKGLHLGINTAHKIDGMSEEESNKIINHLCDGLFVEKYIYDHWYQSDSDLCLFDNAITLHRRLGGIANRMCYRLQHDYNFIQKEPYIPYFKEPFITKYKNTMKEMIK
jgi:alpha-ketoglutarate-dependent taurine dioxygenase